MESPIHLIERNGRQLVLLDLTHVSDPADGLRRIAAAKRWFAQQKPDGSLRVCSDATGSRYENASMTHIRCTTGDATDPQGIGNRIICHVCNEGYDVTVDELRALQSQE